MKNLRKFTVALILIQIVLMVWSAIQIARGESQLYNLSLILINGIFATWNLMVLRDTRDR
jgi:hypothetical protein